MTMYIFRDETATTVLATAYCTAIKSAGNTKNRIADGSEVIPCDTSKGNLIRDESLEFQTIKRAALQYIRSLFEVNITYDNLSTELTRSLDVLSGLKLYCDKMLGNKDNAGQLIGGKQQVQDAFIQNVEMFKIFNKGTAYASTIGEVFYTIVGFILFQQTSTDQQFMRIRDVLDKMPAQFDGLFTSP